MKEIPLTQGKVALVDDEDYEGLMRWKWRCLKTSRGRADYAVRSIYEQTGEQIAILMHRVILNTPLGYGTDHINGNGLDNRKKNLRIATQAQNVCNVGKYRNNTSGYKGVSWDKDRKKWRASIRFKSKQIYLGLFQNKREAAKAYNKAAIKYHGEFAVLNQTVRGI